MDVKIVKEDENYYRFYHGGDYIGHAEYAKGGQGVRAFFFTQSSPGFNEPMMMAVVIIMRELDTTKNAAQQYIITEKAITRIREKEEKKKSKKKRGK